MMGTELRDVNHTKRAPSSLDSDLYLQPSSIQVIPVGLPDTDPYPNLRPIPLRIFSILNVILWTLCTALEVSLMPSYGLGIWCSVLYMLTGFLGYSASYRPTKAILVAVAVLSSSAIAFALLASILAALAQYSSLNCCNSGGFWSRWEMCTHLQFSLESCSVVALANNAVTLSLVSHCLCCSSQSAHREVIVVPASSSGNTTLSTNLDSNQSLIV